MVRTPDWFNKNVRKCPNNLEHLRTPEFGGRGKPTGAPLENAAIYHDIIHFSPKSKDHIYEKCAPLYERGLSLREIERQTGIAKSTIRETLSARGLTLRNFSKAKRGKKSAPGGMRCGVVPYGFAYLEGKLVVDPRETRVVLQMVKLWQSGKSYKAIAEKLNGQGIPTRLGKRWTHSVVKAVVKRHLEQKSST